MYELLNRGVSTSKALGLLLTLFTITSIASIWYYIEVTRSMEFELAPINMPEKTASAFSPLSQEECQELCLSKGYSGGSCSCVEEGEVVGSCTPDDKCVCF